MSLVLLNSLGTILQNGVSWINPQVISTVVAVIAFLMALHQWRTAQQWKRAEFVASEVKDAFSDPSVRTVLYLLDWNARYYDLREKDDGPTELKKVLINDEMLTRALRIHWEGESGEELQKGKAGFTPTEERIRVVFDDFLGRLQRFAHFKEAELISNDDILPYWRYWLQAMTIPEPHRKSAAVLKAIWRYVNAYGYADVIALVTDLGFDLNPFLPPESLAGSAQTGKKLLEAPASAGKRLKGHVETGRGS